MIKVEFTVDEATALTQLLDIAVRARGLEIAGNANHLLNKLRMATAVAQAMGELDTPPTTVEVKAEPEVNEAPAPIRTKGKGKKLNGKAEAAH